jgi:hypothetical protein
MDGEVRWVEMWLVWISLLLCGIVFMLGAIIEELQRHRKK